MQNSLGFWNDPKYSLVRHAIVAGGAGFAIAVLQAISQTTFGPMLDVVIPVIAGVGIRYLTQYASSV